MITYALHILRERRPLWAAVAALAFLTVLPASLTAVLLPAALVALGLTGDVGLAAALLPRPFDLPFGVLLAGAALLLLIGFSVWARLQALALWLSDDRNESSLRAGWAAGRRSWRAIAGLTLAVHLAVLVVAGGALVVVAGFGGGLGVLVVLALLLALRTVARVYLTLAQRALVLEELPVRAAWSAARRIVPQRRPKIVAAWVTLAALGAAVWFATRLVTPALQDTALRFDAGGSHNLMREGVQLVVAVPLEAVILALSVGVWTACFLDLKEPLAAGARAGGWMPAAMAGLLVVVLLGNGGAAVVERLYLDERDRLTREVEARELAPEEVVGVPPADPIGEPGRTRYRVRASLDAEQLNWTTVVDYRNRTTETLTDIGINVYPAAFTRRAEDLPLAADLLASDATGFYRAQIEPGTLSLDRVLVLAEEVPVRLDDTALVVPLPRALPPGQGTRLAIDLSMQLPRFPERFGVWEELTLLGNWIPTVAVRDAGQWRLDPYGAVGDPFFSELADYIVDLEVDEGVGVVGSGSLTRIVNAEPDRRTWRFEGGSMRDAAFAAGRFLRGLERETGTGTIRVWYRGDRTLEAQRSLNNAVSATNDFTARFGALPYDEIDVVLKRGFFGGMEYPGLIFVSEGPDSLELLGPLPDLLRYAGFSAAESRYVIGHEIAHQWWYAAVGNDQVREPWLDEAFAELSVRLWLRAHGDERVWQMTNLRTEARARPGVVDAQIADFTDNGSYTDAVYTSGSEVLLRLRAGMGRAAFDRLLREWYEQQRLKTATIDDFEDLVGEIGGSEAADLFRRYRRSTSVVQSPPAS